MIIHYKTQTDLSRINKQIKHPESRFYFFNSIKKGKQTTGQELRDKFDVIFSRVQSILDMKKEVPAVKIYLYPGKQELHQAFQSIYNAKTRMRAWYIFEYNAIYINIKDVSAGIIAHEMAHAVVNNFFEIRPPRVAAEILAKYVDKNLF